ncbi:MAG TPA: hypothetical protein VKZ45_02560 [Vicingaceae bacterium]|nr:hypothetical protein [Vicingaceae bacterium]
MQKPTFNELRNAILKQIETITAIENQGAEIIKNQQYELAEKFRAESNLPELKSELKNSIKDWNDNVNSLELIAENIEFIKASKQFLSQFEDNTQEFNQLILDEIEKLSEARQTALSNKDFKLAGQMVDKSVALKQKLASE